VVEPRTRIESIGDETTILATFAAAQAASVGLQSASPPVHDPRTVAAKRTTAALDTLGG
jgi:hypothetical protein